MAEWRADFLGVDRPLVAYSSPMQTIVTRRDFVAMAAAGAGGVAGCRLSAQPRDMPVRVIATTGEQLPIVGLGSTRPVTAIAERGSGPVEAVVRTLVEHGGRVIDTWPRSDFNDDAF